MQKLGRNHGRYHGETIDIDAVLRDVREMALKSAWDFEPARATTELELQTWRKVVPQPRRRIYISAGIHGDEPAGPLAVRQLLLENPWPADIEVWLCPCLNPTG